MSDTGAAARDAPAKAADHFLAHLAEEDLAVNVTNLPEGVEIALTEAECTSRFGEKLDKFESGDMPSVVADSALPKSIPAMGMRVGALTATLFEEKGWRRMHVAKWTSVSPTPPPIASKQSRIWPVYVTVNEIWPPSRPTRPRWRIPKSPKVSPQPTTSSISCGQQQHRR